MKLGKGGDRQLSNLNLWCFFLHLKPKLLWSLGLFAVRKFSERRFQHFSKPNLSMRLVCLVYLLASDFETPWQEKLQRKAIGSGRSPGPSIADSIVQRAFFFGGGIPNETFSLAERFKHIQQVIQTYSKHEADTLAVALWEVFGP